MVGWADILVAERGDGIQGLASAHLPGARVKNLLIHVCEPL